VFKRIAVKLHNLVIRLRKEDVLAIRVRRAIESRRRGEARSGGLKLAALSTLLRVEWLAREIHPWEQNSRQDHKDRLFTEQCLEDTLAVVERLFKEMPDLRTLEIGVRREASAAPLLAGVVKRAQLEQAGNRAPGMKLKMIGIQFHIFNWKLEPLDELPMNPMAFVSAPSADGVEASAQ
jgi:hypothetical protein